MQLLDVCLRAMTLRRRLNRNPVAHGCDATGDASSTQPGPKYLYFLHCIFLILKFPH